MSDRLYLPSFAELTDRLAICVRKWALIADCRENMSREIEAICHDLSLFDVCLTGELIEVILTLGLVNNLIWENESAARQGKDQDLPLLRKTHGMNALRQRLKNRLQQFCDPERTEPKHEYMAEKFAEVEFHALKTNHA